MQLSYFFDNGISRNDVIIDKFIVNESKSHRVVPPLDEVDGKSLSYEEYQA